MIYLLGILLMALMAWAHRLHGGGWPSSWSRAVSTGIYALVFALANYYIYDLWQLALLSALVSGWGLSKGHGNVYEMEGVNVTNDEPEWLERYGGRWAWRKLERWTGKDIYTPEYSWFIMGLKGLIIGLPVAPVGVALALLWPAGYWFGFVYRDKDDGTVEWASGAGAGLVVFLAVLLHLFLIDIL